MFAAGILARTHGQILWCVTAGMILKLIFPRRFERLSVVFYLAMGWIILAVAKLLSAAPASVDLWLLVKGGLVYSAGAGFFLAERLPFHKPVWHGFVLVAVALQFAAIANSAR